MRRFDEFSAGMKRRVLLAGALIRQPDVLLLDEPTNHLDIESIIWLQGYLSRFSGTLIFITHDRVFLQETAKRIVEIDRGRLFDWTCDYQTFLRRRDELLAAEEAAQAHFDRKTCRGRKVDSPGNQSPTDQKRRQSSGTEANAPGTVSATPESRCGEDAFAGRREVRPPCRTP